MYKPLEASLLDSAMIKITTFQKKDQNARVTTPSIHAGNASLKILSGQVRGLP